VVRVPLCARVSRVCPLCVPAPPGVFLPVYRDLLLLVGLVGCEIGLCAFVRPRVPCVPCVSRLPRCLFTGTCLVFGCFKGRVAAGRTYPLRRCLVYVCTS